MRRDNGALGIAAIAIAALACTEQATDSGDPAVARGEKIYRNVCVACHNADPNQAGPLGPAIAGASLELLEAKVLRGEYPPGYAPQRSTQQMPRFEFLEPNIGDVAAFLASQKQ